MAIWRSSVTCVATRMPRATYNPSAWREPAACCRRLIFRKIDDAVKLIGGYQLAELLLFIQRNDFDVRIMLRTLRARNQHVIPRKNCFYPRRRHKTACITASGFTRIVMLK